ncbi:hypothetical protein CONCODRAFT_9601 [Conidiobolus coronatus NRRL 28638]|uniref:BRCT domain-containing protein n=1 Tax=Conidiobolus coronatus (strain ATCC 28846 / CBS 209.66 / NRRL 28638) TaxID=796925 RepID=A0A137NZA7_CONC2|nr:hypothetical protein CONCODRAFT_9601 [Conidiobolus coronatus NRRL 28638]|eukprot:KXN68173.1 hypothetical protein CONCODRAFT_9601 [Conidiobolus coronatus NRRL 28638]
MRVKKDKSNKPKNKITNYFRSTKENYRGSKALSDVSEEEEEPVQLNFIDEYRRLRALRDLNRQNWDQLPIYYKLELNDYRKYQTPVNTQRGTLQEEVDFDDSINKCKDVSRGNILYFRGNINASQYMPINSRIELSLNPITQDNNKIFEGCTIYVPDYTRGKITSLLRILILRNGGELRTNIQKEIADITHMIYPILDYPKKCVLIKLFSLRGLPKIVTPYWILDSLRAGKKLNCLSYATDKSMNTLMNYFEVLEDEEGHRRRVEVDERREDNNNNSDSDIYS